jgi:hypothetical protein
MVETPGFACRPVSEDRVHTVVVSQPESNNWRSYALEGETLTETGSFLLGASTFGRVAWTRDGRVGAVVQDDGTLGLISAQDGVVGVFGGFYQVFDTKSLTMDPNGQTLWILLADSAERGGGVAWLSLDCESGWPDYPHRWRDSTRSSALLIGERTVLVADEVDGEAGFSAYELASPRGDVLQGLPLFEHEDHLISDAVMAPDGRIWAAEVSASSRVPHSVSVLNADLSLAGRVPVADPVALVAHPSDGRMLVLSADQGELLQISPDLEVDHIQSSSLPLAAAGLHTGPDAGLVLVAETEAIVLLRWTPTGMEELQRVALSSPPGAIGVSP